MGTDRLTSMLLDYGTGHAVGTCSTQMVFYQHLQIFGTAGRIEMPIPFNAPARSADPHHRRQRRRPLRRRHLARRSRHLQPVHDPGRPVLEGHHRGHRRALTDRRRREEHGVHRCHLQVSGHRTLGGTAVTVPIYLGLDSSTQSVTATAVDVDDRTPTAARSSSSASFRYDDVLPRYGTHHGVLRSADPRTVHAPPLMWSEALDRMIADLARDTGVDWRRLRAISGSAQQHGSVYLNARPRSGWRPRRGATARRPARRCLLPQPHRRSGWTRARPGSARKSRRRSAARGRSRASPARARSSASPGRRSASSPKTTRRLRGDRARPPRQLVDGVAARRRRTRRSIRATARA